MFAQNVLLLLGSGFIHSAVAASGKSFTTWDCCKPACAWQSNLKSVSGSAKVCDINNSPLSNGLNAQSGCESGGKGFLCDSYVPTPTGDNMAYGFATMMSNLDCCKCFQLTWTSGNAAGKSMVVQAINVGAPSGDVGNSDIIILTPGGGVGPNSAGCRNQYGTSWGNQNGGVSDRNACGNLPQNLQGGCYWRFNWAKGDMNGWNINYQQVQCPSRLTSISGCSA